jgi:hypothetical protein
MTSRAPVTVRVSAWVYVCSFIPGLVSLVTNPTIATLARARPVTFAIAITLLFMPVGLMGLVAYLAYHRRNWARWVQCAIVIGTTLYQLPHDLKTVTILKGSASSTALLFGLVTLAQIASVVLLLLPEANRWYRDSSHVTGPT